MSRQTFAKDRCRAQTSVSHSDCNAASRYQIRLRGARSRPLCEDPAERNCGNRKRPVAINQPCRAGSGASTVMPWPRRSSATHCSLRGKTLSRDAPGAPASHQRRKPPYPSSVRSLG